MITNKTIFIAHNWSDASLCQQSKALAIAFSEANKVIFLSAKKNGLNNKKVNQNLTLFEWPSKRPTGLKDFFFVVKKIIKYKPDIVITTFAANNIMLVTSWLFGVKVRMCYHNTLIAQIVADSTRLTWRHRFNIYRKGLVYSLATHLLPSSIAAVADLRIHYKIQPSKAFVFPNALADRNLKNHDTDTKTIGFIGRLDYSKGVDILIHVFEQIQLTFPDITLVLVGDGKQRQALELQALPFGDKITFTGAVSYKEVFTYLQTFTCLVVPSRTDNLPTVILEAFSCYTPVIASNAGGIPDMIEDNYNGLLFENESAARLAAKLILLLSNNNERSRLANNARQSFLEKYCITTLPLRFEQLLTATHYL